MASLAEMYAKLGRMMGRSYEETVQILTKLFRSMESQLRSETMVVFEKVSIYDTRTLFRQDDSKP